jgi:glycosyltransferase involved in cell wall biosynthesis
MKEKDKSKTSCSLVIRCYNEEQHIGRLLDGVMKQALKDVEIILVDSGSTDSTLSIASKYPIKEVSIKPEDFSFGRAINVGCAAASGEFIVLASAHVYPVYKDWLELLIEPFNNSDVAIVYGKQRSGEKARYSEQQIYKKWFPDSSINYQKHPFCNNANAAIRRSIWMQLPYDEELTGLEDLDWAKRVIGMGKKIAYCADAEVIHIHNETFLKTYNRYRREAMAFKRIYSRETFSLLDFFKLFIINTVTDYYHAIRDDQFCKNLFSILQYRITQFWGTYIGYKQHGSITQQLAKRFYYPDGFNRKKITNAEKDNVRKVDYGHH